EYDAQLVPLEELLEQSDYVTLHCPLSEQTHHLIDAGALRRMKSSAYLINTSRGPVVDEEALIAALEKSEIAGAGIDVFEHEPVDPENPLLHMDNVVLTPHVAGSSEPAWKAICRRAGEEAARVLRGGRPQVLVNPEVLGRLGLA
ncbi:MAG: C-terminal binding protein, partial [Gemmatimonadetes bacterium]|nr:C-terminal binding protein [Gemmatimonadota bacterium]